jgi:hypothetical protein
VLCGDRYLGRCTGRDQQDNRKQKFEQIIAHETGRELFPESQISARKLPAAVQQRHCCTAKSIYGFGANTRAGEAAQNAGSRESRGP